LGHRLLLLGVAASVLCGLVLAGVDGVTARVGEVLTLHLVLLVARVLFK